MILRVDPGSPVPPYEQLREQVVTMMATGRLPEGTRLPPIRQLASDLGLAPGTVARAYRELENDRLVVSRGRHGTFVGVVQTTAADADADAGLADAARAFAVRAHQLGADAGTALDHARKALRELAAAQAP